ncbi:hypothetical protein [Sphingomonas sp. VNH70]|uniref:ParB/RepB/Spo0J family partition protein n=1 Tax=Sphingomonas silueang TaxID=3156617 RepID=UPI0032B43D79
MSAVGPKVVGQLIELDPDQIDASKRLLPLDPAWVDAIGLLMKTDGQLTPIEVCRLPGRTDYTLVVGGHRHAGAAKYGLKLRAEVVTADAMARRLREASENVNRRNLAPLDRAKAIAEMVAVQKIAAGLAPDQDGRAASANARWQECIEREAEDATATFAVAYGWADNVGATVGLAARTVRDDLALLRRIPTSIVEALRRKDHPAFHNAAQLKALAGLDPEEQQHVLGLLIHANAKIAGAPFDKVTDAITAMRGKEPPRPDAKRLNAFTGAFARMAPAEKKGALAELSHRLPAGFRIVEGKEAQAKPAFPAKHAEYREDTLEAIDAIRELIEGLLEDEVLDDERHSALASAATRLHVARLTIAGNGFQLGDDA